MGSSAGAIDFYWLEYQVRGARRLDEGHRATAVMRIKNNCSCMDAIKVDEQDVARWLEGRLVRVAAGHAGAEP
jgi:hypothetical protein